MDWAIKPGHVSVVKLFLYVIPSVCPSAIIRYLIQSFLFLSNVANSTIFVSNDLFTFVKHYFRYIASSAIIRYLIQSFLFLSNVANSTIFVSNDLFTFVKHYFRYIASSAIIRYLIQSFLFLSNVANSTIFVSNDLFTFVKHYFRYIASLSASISAFFVSSTPSNSHFSHGLLSHIILWKKRRALTVELTIICPRKEYWPSRVSNQRPPVLKSCAQRTGLP